MAKKIVMQASDIMAAEIGLRRANDRQEGGGHYKGAYTQEHWDYCWEHGYNMLQYAASKYLERYKRKNGREDLEKAKHYIDKLIELEYPE